MIIGRISAINLSPNGQKLQVTIMFFDDNDPANSGVGQLPPQKTIGPPVILQYEPSLTGVELQSAIKTDVKAKIIVLSQAVTALQVVPNFIQVGNLINENS